MRFEEAAQLRIRLDAAHQTDPAGNPAHRSADRLLRPGNLVALVSVLRDSLAAKAERRRDLVGDANAGLTLRFVPAEPILVDDVRHAGLVVGGDVLDRHFDGAFSFTD